MQFDRPRCADRDDEVGATEHRRAEAESLLTPGFSSVPLT
jgi:hypothetical protein